MSEEFDRQAVIDRAGRFARLSEDIDAFLNSAIDLMSEEDHRIYAALNTEVHQLLQQPHTEEPVRNLNIAMCMLATGLCALCDRVAVGALRTLDRIDRESGRR